MPGVGGAAAPGEAAATHLPSAVRPRAWLYTCALAFALGAAAGVSAPHIFPGLVGGEAPAAAGDGAWRTSVAAKLDLTTSQSLLGLPRQSSVLLEDLAKVGKQVGLDLTADRLALVGRAIGRVELYHFEGVPLAEIVYFDPENGPIALSVLARPGAPSGLEGERREGMNLAVWSTARHAFSLTGRAPPEVLQGLAKELAGKISS
jgi:hypothetical protein